MRGRGKDRGSATILVLAAALLVSTVAVAAAGVGAALICRRHAQVAADLSALAVADDLVRLRTDPCSSGHEIAEANGATLTSCRVDGATVTVQVTVRAPPWLASAAITAHARAGPAGGSGEPIGPGKPRVMRRPSAPG